MPKPKKPKPKNDAEKTHPGFEIICLTNTCGSTNVIVDSNLGFSEVSGTWGGVYLECLNCGAVTVIYGDD